MNHRTVLHRIRNGFCIEYGTVFGSNMERFCVNFEQQMHTYTCMHAFTCITPPLTHSTPPNKHTHTLAHQHKYRKSPIQHTSEHTTPPYCTCSLHAHVHTRACTHTHHTTPLHATPSHPILSSILAYMHMVHM